MILIRHGESTWNRSQRFTGWADVGLTTHGTHQMREAGRQLRARGIDIGTCFTSRLRRSIDAAEALFETLAQRPAVLQQDWRLNERHYGALTGLNKADAVRDHGRARVQHWRRGFDATPPPLQETNRPADILLPTPSDDPVTSTIPAAESLRDVVARVTAVWTDRLKPALHPTQATLVVAHGNSLRALRMIVEELDPQTISRCEIDNAAPLIYTFRADARLSQITCLPAFEPERSQIL